MAAIVIVIVVAIVVYVVGGESVGTPASVRYHNASDFQRITKIQFPNVELVDSALYESFSLMEVTESFVLMDEGSRSELIKAIEGGKYWERDEEGYKFYLLPEEDFEVFAESVWPKTEDGQDDWDGDYIKILVPVSNDTILVKYGWER